MQPFPPSAIFLPASFMKSIKLPSQHDHHVYGWNKNGQDHQQLSKINIDFGIQIYFEYSFYFEKGDQLHHAKADSHILRTAH